MTVHEYERVARHRSLAPDPSGAQGSRQPVRLSPVQYGKLIEPLNPGRIGQDGKGFDHLEAWDVESSMTRIFGFGMWSTEILAEECVSERQLDDHKWSVSWRVRMRLTAYDPEGAPLGPWENGTVETGVQRTPGEAHELAYKAAVSGALKRCAKAMGNQFGLSLYAGRTGRNEPRLVAVAATLNPPRDEQGPLDGLLAAAARAGIERQDLEDTCLQAYGCALDQADPAMVAALRRQLDEAAA